MREFFCSSSLRTRTSVIGSFRSPKTLSMARKEASICLLPSCIEVIKMIMSYNRIQIEVDDEQPRRVEIFAVEPISLSAPKSKYFFVELVGGWTLLYDHSVPVDMKYVDYDRNVNHLGSGELVNFKIYTMDSKPNISKIKIEIESENDPFFVAKFECDEHFFALVKKQQALKIGLQELPTIIIKCLNRIEEQKKKLSAGLLVYSDGKSRLCLSYCSQFKNIEILHLDLNQQSDEQIEEVIKYKYQAMRGSIRAAEQRLAKIAQIIRDKNPSLLQQICKTSKQE